jgi:hypothetical protein
MPTANPAERLAPIVAQLYDVAGNSAIPAATRKKLLLLAYDLRGDMMNLVSKQFTEATPAYTAALRSIDRVAASLDDAQKRIDKAQDLVTDVAALARAVDGLLKEIVNRTIG